MKNKIITRKYIKNKKLKSKRKYRKNRKNIRKRKTNIKNFKKLKRRSRKQKKYLKTGGMWVKKNSNTWVKSNCESKVQELCRIFLFNNKQNNRNTNTSISSGNVNPTLLFETKIGISTPSHNNFEVNTPKPKFKLYYLSGDGIQKPIILRCVQVVNKHTKNIVMNELLEITKLTPEENTLVGERDDFILKCMKILNSTPNTTYNDIQDTPSDSVEIPQILNKSNNYKVEKKIKKPKKIPINDNENKNNNTDEILNCLFHKEALNTYYLLTNNEQNNSQPINIQTDESPPQLKDLFSKCGDKSQTKIAKVILKEFETSPPPPIIPLITPTLSELNGNDYHTKVVYYTP